MTKKKQFFTYKGRPLVRSGNTIYYGDLSEEAVVMMQIMAKENIKELPVATSVNVQLLLTDESIPLMERIIKRSNQPSLYAALDIATIWLDRA